MKSMYADAAVELRVPGARAAEALWLPFQALDDFEGKKDDPVELTATDNRPRHARSGATATCRRLSSTTRFSRLTPASSRRCRPASRPTRRDSCRPCTKRRK